MRVWALPIRSSKEWVEIKEEYLFFWTYFTPIKVYDTITVPKERISDYYQQFANSSHKEKMTPSQYISSMSLTTEEKYAAIRKTKPAQIIEYFDMKKTTYQTETQVKVDEAVFQAFPSEIVFQNFSAKRTYQVPIQLRNNDKVPRSIQISRENGPFFSVSVPEENNSKIAPQTTIFWRMLKAKGKNASQNT